MSKKMSMELLQTDLRIDTYSTSPGGQQTNGCYNSVRMTHIPTGLSVISDTERSIYRNKLKAIEELRKKVIDYVLGAS
jgi:protein subunit release factor A